MKTPNLLFVSALLSTTLGAGCFDMEPSAMPADGSADGSTGAPDEGSSGGDVESADGSSSGAVDGSSGDPEQPEIEPGTWSELVGPCGGSETNALWFDDPQTGFIGCGENADGEGLYVTVDGGASWESIAPFIEVRIMDIRRGPDGILRGAGIHQLDDYPVWTFDESSPTLDPTGLYSPSNNAFLAVNQAENIAVTADGQMLIDSLTGTTAAYAAAGAFEEIPSLGEGLLDDPDAPGFQVRRIQAWDGRFYAVGSVINDPARVHLPSQMPGATHHFHTVRLQPETRDGELLDMHVWDDEHILVAGHDQSERWPLLYLVEGADPYDPASWEKIELRDSGLEYQGGINDLHVQGDRVIAVGEKIPTALGGFVVLSEDGGRTWDDVTPPGAPQTGPLSSGWLFDDGTMVVAGGGGELWRYAAG